MADYADNSNKAREERPKPTPVVGTDDIGTTAKPKLSGLIIANKDLKDIGSHLMEDVIAPGLKNTLYDLAHNSLEMLLYGSVNNRRTQPRTNYTTYSQSSRPYSPSTSNRPQAQEPRREIDIYDFESVPPFTNRGAAEKVLMEMRGYLEDYSVMSVADFYEFFPREDPAIAEWCRKVSFTAEKWGWTDFLDSEVVHYRDGYRIIPPKPKQI